MLKMKTLLWLAASMVCAGSAGAATLTFNETATATGSLDGQAFTDSLVTFSGSGDTNNVSYEGSGIYILVLPSVALSIAGGGTDTFSDQIQLVSNQSRPAVGLGDNTTGFAVLFDGTPLAAMICRLRSVRRPVPLS